MQKAAYVSASFDIVPKTLTITGGIRYFDMYDSEHGGDVGSFGCKQCSPDAPISALPAGQRLDFRQADPHARRYRPSWPRQPQLARHAGRDAVLHVFAGLSAGRLQPRRSAGAAGCERRCAVPYAEELHLGPAHQQRGRLEERCWLDHGCCSTARSTRRTGITRSWSSSARRAAWQRQLPRPMARITGCGASSCRSPRPDVLRG